MKWFGSSNKRENEEPVKNATFDETGYICSRCGSFNPMSAKFCQYCGEESFTVSEINRIETEKPEEQAISQKNEITQYLEKLNLLNLADKQFQISVQLENGATEQVRLFGRQNSNDALNSLRAVGVLRADEQYRFTDWPSANSCIGPWYHHVSACVCELNPDRIYHIVRINNNDFVLLYGCPNSKSVKTNTVLEQVKVEIIDYEI